MENVVLTIHLILAVFLIGVVLLQRSEGGALFGSSSGLMSGRGATTALSKVTWGLAAAFIVTSLALTVLAAQRSGEASLLDRIGTTPPAAESPAEPTPAPLPPATDSLPPAGLPPLAPPPAE
ncbi:MAG TPA: preprotein translocase subunit SecG [Paracoccaceae bacterium]|nr:preprotein translocase subunit SecG [Paracoccaceae bacterium]